MADRSKMVIQDRQVAMEEVRPISREQTQSLTPRHRPTLVMMLVQVWVHCKKDRLGLGGAVQVVDT